MGERERVRHRQRLEARATLPQRQIDQHLAIHHQDVPGHVDHRHRRHDRRVGRDPTEPRLERMERHHAAVVKREDLAIEHHVGVEMHRRTGDLRKLRRDVLQVAAVERGLGAAPVQLTPDSVIFVFNPHVFAEPRHRFRRVGDRGREHGSKRHEPARSRVVETSGAGQACGRAEVSGEHHGAAHGRGLRSEGDGDGLLDQSFAQADAQLGGDQLGDIASLVRARAAEERAEQRGTLPRDARAGDLGERLIEIVDRDRRGLASRETG